MQPAAPALSLRRYGASPGSHAHAHFQVLVGLEGALDLDVEGRGHRLQAGEGCVIAPGARHDFEARSGSLCLVLDAHSPHWAACTAAGPFAPQLPPTVPALARYLQAALEQGQPLAQQFGPALLLEAWQPTPLPTAAFAARARRIDWPALAAWALAQPGALPDLAALAARVHLSPGQLNARCRAECGQPLMAWLRGQRLVQARALRAQGLAVAEVARRVGYRSPSALTAALRRQHGG